MEAERGETRLDGPAWAVAVLLCIFAVALIVRSATSSNHGGIDVRPLGLVCASAVLVGAFGRRRSFLGRPAAVALSASGCFGGGVLFVLDRFNLLVEYEVWIRRGMPGPWEV